VSDSFLQSLELLLKRQRGPQSVTRQFRQLKHNDDILPKLQTQLETALEAHKKFEPIVYYTQGPRDDGIDIVIRCRTTNERDEERELIGFQVKSFGDLSKKDYMNLLKAQRDDSFRKVQGLSYYFILLCTDGIKHGEKVRSINAEFRSAARTKVIEPAYSYTFLNCPKTSVEAFIKRTIQAGDIVFRRALESLSQPTPSAQALAVFLSVKAVLLGDNEFTESQLLADAVLRSVYAELKNKQAWLLGAALEDTGQLEPGSENDEGELDEDDDDTESPIQLADFEAQITEDLSHLLRRLRGVSHRCLSEMPHLIL
jgi:hypothetical protein